MKRLLVLTWIVLLGMTACSNQSASSHDSANTFDTSSTSSMNSPETLLIEAKALLNSIQGNMTHLDMLFHSDSSMTPTEYAAFLLAFDDCQFPTAEGVDMTACTPLMAMHTDMLRKRKIDQNSKLFVLRTLINSDNPRLRSGAYIQIDGTEPDDFFDFLFKKAQDENDATVIPFAYGAIQSFITHNREVTDEMCDFYEKAAVSDNWILRNMAAQTFGFKAVANKRPSLVNILISMYTDEVISVSASAINSSAAYDNDTVIEPLAAILNDDSQAALHGYAVNTLNHFWLDYPFFRNHNAEAYHAVLDYLKRPHAEDAMPSDLVFEQLSFVNTDSTNYKAWLADADYFNAQDLVEALQNLALTDNINIFALANAMQAIRVFGGPDALNAIKNSLALKAPQPEMTVQDNTTGPIVHN